MIVKLPIPQCYLCLSTASYPWMWTTCP
jgi:hypothetical protein